MSRSRIHTIVVTVMALLLGTVLPAFTTAARGEVLPGTAQISGVVSDADGPLADITVTLYAFDEDLGFDFWADTSTDEAGSYSFADLGTGDYTLQFFDPSDGHEVTFPDGATDFPQTVDDPGVVHVVDGEVQVVDVVMPVVAPPVTAEGTVLGDGAGLSDADVSLYRRGDVDAGEDPWEVVDSALTDESGAYEFLGLQEGQEYTVSADAFGRMARFLGDVAQAADAVPFTAAATNHLDPITLPVAPSVAGTVTRGGEPVEDVSVTAYRWNPDEEVFEESRGVATGPAGGYRVFLPAAGTYTLLFDDFDGDQEWLSGDESQPTGPGAPGTFTVADGAELTRDFSFPVALHGTGTVVSDGGPLADATVRVYRHTEADGWFATDRTATTDGQGHYSVSVPRNATISVRAAHGGYSPRYLGDTATLGDPTGANSRQTGADADVDLGAVTLPVRSSTLGRVAGQQLAYCNQHVLEANDDESTDAVAIPFPLKFFGAPYSELYVNNNGNVTFGQPQSQFTPTDLTGDGAPIIAPFFADVDTRGGDSNQVTWGTSGDSLCVNWADVGYFSSHDDKLNTFQLILTRDSAGAGRVEGDFDIRFNYDEIGWETGDASDGENGEGGTSAAVGFSAGTGEPGTFVQLPGSFQNGQLLDGGVHALVAGSQNSLQVGRYNFEVRNEGLQTSLGSVSGQVVKDVAASTPVVDATVQVCAQNGSRCAYAQTNDQGSYSATGVPAGGYDITVWPPSDELFGGGTSVTVVAGQTAIAPQIRLAAPAPMPAGTTINGRNDGGVPSVYFGEPLALSVTGCPGVASPTYTVRLSTGEVLRTGALAPGAAGTYTATIPEFYPNHGNATITTNVPGTCGGAPVAFDIYIDPSGVVTDQFGRLLDGASVTLFRSDSPDGPFEPVPDGSPVMSPSNRTNPMVTSADGRFAWDVLSGYYKVKAEHAGCDPSTTAAMQVPPERLDLLVKLTCPDSTVAPSRLPVIKNPPVPGTLLGVTPGAWPAAMAPESYEWFRDGASIATGATYRVAAGDVGHQITVKETARRPAYTQENGSGVVVTFASTVSPESAAVTGRKAASTTAARLAKSKIRARARGKVSVTVAAPPVTGPTGGLTIKVDRRARVATTLAAWRGGRITLTLPRLARGRHKVQAVYAGSAATLGSSSRVLTLTVTR